MSSHDVIIVGGGAAGLAAARQLSALGVRDVVVLEREAQAGGVARHCGHLGFGWRAFRRIMSGPGFAQRLCESVTDLDVRCGVSVLALQPGGLLATRSAAGLQELRGKRVLIATGVREMPRAARLIGGVRAQGVLTTGALQQFAYISRIKPCSRPVIVGSEWVSFSALLTCRHLGIRPVALLEPGARILAPHPGTVVARALFGVPVMTQTSLLSIEGGERIEAVEVERAGQRLRIACDAVVFTGQFVPESALFVDGPFTRDPATGGPAIDQFFRCSDTTYFAAGNALRPVETSGWCWNEGVAAAQAIAADLHEGLPTAAMDVAAQAPFKYVYPQRLVPDGRAVTLYARVQRAVRGRLRVRAGERVLVERAVSYLPERRIALALPGAALSALGAEAQITLQIIE